MRKYLCVILLSFLVAGCATGKDTLESYVYEPGLILKDPHFDHYKVNRDELERQYVTKEITYAEYIEQKKELDGQYDNEVRKREKILSDGL